MAPNLKQWRRSYKYLPFGAGEGDIAKASTSDLEAAHRLMEPCKDKPPGYEFQFAPADVNPRTIFSYVEKLILDENLRYARVCRELATRIQSDDAAAALALLKSALLPVSSAHAFQYDDADNSWWESIEQQADRLAAEHTKLSGELSNLTGEAGEYDDDTLALVSRWRTSLQECAAVYGLLGAAFAISKKLDAWNFSIKASMVALEERLGHRHEAGKLQDECLEILRINDDLWSNLVDRAIDRPVIVAPASVPPAPMVNIIETAVAQLLDSKLEPLLRSMGDNLRITHTVHDRLDLIVEKLIDLNQLSELTWQQIRKLARQEPDYAEVRRGIDTSLASRLGDTWRQLKPDSRKDLVDAEYVFQQCTRWGTGWRMAVLGYCTTAERELKVTYRAARDEVLAVSNKEAGTIETLGDLIQALEKLGTWLPKSKDLPALKALLDSAEVLRRLNTIRVRAAHPTDREVSRDEAVWARDALLIRRSGPLLVKILAVRLSQ